MSSKTPLDSPWDPNGLEDVDRCPFCLSSQGATLAHGDVQDWSFYCAPGKWNYWQCAGCGSIYLNPRPTSGSIGKAYAVYYTHVLFAEGKLLPAAKIRLKNECLSHRFGIDVRPRIGLPRALGRFLAPIQAKVTAPFGFAELAKFPKGDFIDVGCGAGDMVDVARQIGWRARGIEVDPEAVRTARARGLDIVEGGYELLEFHKKSFDLVYCSHVLEHVYDPRDLLRRIKESLRRRGSLILSLPNADSALRAYFKDDWRGLEAPRHLAIPTERRLVTLLESMDFRVVSHKNPRLATAAESFRIRRRGTAIDRSDRENASRLANELFVDNTNADFIELVCTLG